MNDSNLRFRLRQLPREIEPAHDLWPGIAARLHATPKRHSRHAWAGGFALAASLLAAVFVWRAGPDTTPAAPDVRGADPVAAMVRTEANAMTLGYQAALAEYGDHAVPSAVEPAIADLDRSARDIRAALAASPESVRLLQMLQRTYTRRLELTHRLATG
jgi:hypothetical protein